MVGPIVESIQSKKHPPPGTFLKEVLLERREENPTHQLQINDVPGVWSRECNVGNAHPTVTILSPRMAWFKRLLYSTLT